MSLTAAAVLTQISNSLLGCRAWDLEPSQWSSRKPLFRIVRKGRENFVVVSSVKKLSNDFDSYFVQYSVQC